MNPSAYIAARFSRAGEMWAYRDELELYDIEVTATWINGSHKIIPDVESVEEYDFNHQCAVDDMEDIEAADMFITFSETPTEFAERPTGGRHVELGMALYLNKDIHVIGPRENVFYYLRSINVYADWNQFMEEFIIPNYHYIEADESL